MDLIRRHVAQARRRMALQQFVRVLPWCLCFALVLAVMALAVPKLWVVPVQYETWVWSWLGGAAGVGLVAAILWTMAVRRGALDAAIEIDRRFGLKERVSSALMLEPEELTTEAGQALVSDTLRRVEMIVVHERFQVQTGWRSALPILPVALAFAIAFLLPNAQSKQAEAAAAAAAQKQQIKKSAKELQKKLAQKKEEALKKGLVDAEDLFRKITQGIDELNKKDDVDQKKALVKLNDLAKELAERRDTLADPEKMKEQFDKLKDLEKGPADKLADALREGNFQKAVEEMKDLQEKLAKGELSEKDKEKLAQQLEQMKQKLEEIVQAQQEAKRDLQRQIQQKMAQGDLEAVNKLQKQLDALEKAEKQMSKMEAMAQKSDAAQQALRNGDTKEAMSKLAELQQDLESMQQEMEQLETINEIMDELADAKDAMRGEGMEGDQFGMPGDEMMDQIMIGDGMGGEMPGGGYREEKETKTNTYDSRIRATPKAGQAVKIGEAGGPNRAGKSTLDIQEQISSSLNRDSDPLTDQRLPRSQQDHVKEYYERLRKGE